MGTAEAMPAPTEGYILVATGSKKYFDLAAVAALSIRFFDPERPICLACDDPASATEHADLFANVVMLPAGKGLRGTEFHLFLDLVSPFERTLYVDADCLVANARIHEIWLKLAPHLVTFPGRKLEGGVWRRDIGELRRHFNIPYVVQLNGGVFYFRRSTETTRFFETARDLFFKHRDEVTVRHNSGGGYANEPIWGVTMAMTDMDIFPLAAQLNVSTLRTERWQIDSEPSITLHKDGREWRPVVCHFLGLGGTRCPNDLYASFSALLRARAIAT